MTKGSYITWSINLTWLTITLCVHCFITFYCLLLLLSFFLLFFLLQFHNSKYNNMMILILTTHFIDFVHFLGFIAVAIYRFTAHSELICNIILLDADWRCSKKILTVIFLTFFFDSFRGLWLFGDSWLGIAIPVPKF